MNEIMNSSEKPSFFNLITVAAFAAAFAAEAEYLKYSILTESDQFSLKFIPEIKG